MSTKSETAAEVMADMFKHAESGEMVTPLDLARFAERLERALSAQGEAVAYVPACFVQQIQDGETCVDALLWRERKEPSDFAVSRVTHPAPARVTVTEEMVERAVLAYEDHAAKQGFFYPGGIDREQIRTALTAALEADHG